MEDVVVFKKALLKFVESLNQKYELSKTVEDDYFEPGMMENLEQYKGEYNEEDNIITLRIESKGLRYDNQTKNLETLCVGDELQIIRDFENAYNPNNFCIKRNNVSFGNLPADLCNVLACLYDKGYATILSAKASYIERIKDRSRYARQGVLFVEMQIKMRGV